MNILKTLNDSSMVLKCHKMLKTANNLYIVYDLMGKYPTLDEQIEKNLLNEQTKSILYFIFRKKYRTSNFEVPQVYQVREYFIPRFIN